MFTGVLKGEGETLMLDPVGAEELEDTPTPAGSLRSHLTSLAGVLLNQLGGASPELGGELVDGLLPLVGGELSPLQHVSQLLQVAERVSQLAAHRV